MQHYLYVIYCPPIGSKETLIWLETEGKANSELHFPLAAGHFTIYDCKRLTSCGACAGSQFGCAWSLAEGRCMSLADTQRGGTCTNIDPLPGHPNCSLIRVGLVSPTLYLHMTD